MESPFHFEEEEIVTNNSFFDSNGHPIQMAANLESQLGVTAPHVNEKHLSLKKIINNVLSLLNENEKTTLRLKLKGHYGLYEDGNPWIDFEAAWLLNFHSDLNKAEVRHLPSKPPLHDAIKFALSEGRYVPMHHILYSLHLSQFNPEIKNYPLSFSEAVPMEFLHTVKRSDILRTINVQAIFVGTIFPIIGSHFAFIRENFWSFMFLNKFPPSVGIDLYNEYFFYLSCELGKGILPPLDIIPEVIKEKVIAKYRKEEENFCPPI